METFQVVGRLKFKKNLSKIGGDLFPDLVNRYHDLLAVPLTDIYNTITRTGIWRMSDDRVTEFGELSEGGGNIRKGKEIE